MIQMYLSLQTAHPVREPKHKAPKPPEPIVHQLRLPFREVVQPGDRYARLLVMERDDPDDSGRAMWKCLCDCGTVTFVTTKSLRAASTRSCGCLNSEAASLRIKEVMARRHANGFVFPQHKKEDGDA